MTDNEMKLDNMNNSELLSSISNIMSDVLETMLKPIKNDITLLKDKVPVLESDVRDLKENVQSLKEKVPVFDYNIRLLGEQLKAAHASIIKLQCFNETTIMSKLNSIESSYSGTSDRYLKSIERFEKMIDKADVI